MKLIVSQRVKHGAHIERTKLKACKHVALVSFDPQKRSTRWSLNTRMMKSYIQDSGNYWCHSFIFLPKRVLWLLWSFEMDLKILKIQINIPDWRYIWHVNDSTNYYNGWTSLLLSPIGCVYGVLSSQTVILSKIYNNVIPNLEQNT